MAISMFIGHAPPERAGARPPNAIADRLYPLAMSRRSASLANALRIACILWRATPDRAGARPCVPTRSEEMQQNRLIIPYLYIEK